MVCSSSRRQTGVNHQSAESTANASIASIDDKSERLGLCYDDCGILDVGLTAGMTGGHSRMLRTQSPVFYQAQIESIRFFGA